MRNPKLLVIAIVVLLVVVFTLYRSRRGDSRLNVEPHAREEIERAKQR